MTQTPPQHPPLKPKELALADAYISLGPIIGRVRQAAVIAGFAPKSAGGEGSKALKKPHIAAYIREREGAVRAHIEEKQLVHREWVIEQLVKVYHQSMVGEPEMVWVDGKMEHSGLYTFNDRGANKALELLGKEIGMFRDNGKPPPAPFNLTIDLGYEPPKPPPAPVAAPDKKMIDVTPEPVIASNQPGNGLPPEIDLGD